MTDNARTVERYLDGFRTSDHAMVLSCLTDDVEWIIPGAFHLTGKEAFDREIENPAFVGRPEIDLLRLVEQGDVVVAEGRVRSQRADGGRLHALFCDVFEMAAGRIRRLTSYLAVLEGGAELPLEQNKHTVRAFHDAINARDWAALDRLVAPGFVRHSSAAPGVASRDALKESLRREFAIFPDAQETIEEMVAEGDRVAVRHRFRGTQRGPLGPHPPTGKTMVADYLAIYRLEGGLVAESWAEWDNLAGLVQLGHAEPM